MTVKDGKLHFSQLKQFAQSPAHYIVARDAEFSDSTEKRIGRAVHRRWLQNKPILVYEGIRRGKEWEAFYIKALEDHGIMKDDILSPSENEIVVGCVDSLNRHALAGELLAGCKDVEEHITWERDGVECSGTPDAWNDDTLIELKTCSCAKPRKFLYDAHKFGYHAQLAWYDIGLGTKFQQFATNWRKHYIIAVETKPPYSVVVYKVDDARIDQGHMLCEEWMSKYIECRETGFYPSYTTEEPVIWDAEIIIENEEEE